MSGGGSLGHGAGLASLPGMRSADLGDGGDLVRGQHLPLRLWFEALWHVTSQKSGASALGLQRVLGLGSYHTAWNLLHKLRRAMVRPGRERLQGIIEVDEIFIGGPRPGKRGRGAQGKSSPSYAIGARARAAACDLRGRGAARPFALLWVVI
jgi:hypothetical protein